MLSSNSPHSLLQIMQQLCGSLSILRKIAIPRTAAGKVEEEKLLLERRAMQ